MESKITYDNVEPILVGKIRILRLLEVPRTVTTAVVVRKHQAGLALERIRLVVVAVTSQISYANANRRIED